MALDIVSFVRRWNASTLTERSAAQQHFRDLCEALGVPHPTQEDEVGASYTYEKRVAKTGGGEGFADVWKRGYFAWEYKSKGGDLKAAYKQLNEYHEALENPPLLVVCDFVRFEVHTKFENQPTRVFAFNLDDLLQNRDTATSALPPLEVLRYVFGDYNQLRKEHTAPRVTAATARDFLRLAEKLEIERRPEDPQHTKLEIAHFLMRLVFCLFADSVELLPNHTFRQLVRNDRFSPLNFNRKLPALFQAMSQEDGFFGPETIRYFNGGLFKDNATIQLDQAALAILHSAAEHDWSAIEPAIFGTLFERSLDTAKRSMIGAHYTSPEDILLLVEPVVMTPLRRRWAVVQEEVLAALAEEEADPKLSKLPPGLRPNRKPLAILHEWAVELAGVRILDPACGSGNFLYMSLKSLLDLWLEARIFANNHTLALGLDPMPNPTQLFGIEIDLYAHEIASIVVWIGFLQWKREHGIEDESVPLLRELTNIERNDAIMRYDESQKSEEQPNGRPYEPEWPTAEYIIGNPPFVGGNKIRKELGDDYVADLFTLYENQLSAFSDLVCYWFRLAVRELKRNRDIRVGLLATQSIRGGVNRDVLKAVQQNGQIFMAWSDRDWILDGATVHTSFVAFDDGRETTLFLNGESVIRINPDLTTGPDTTTAVALIENKGIWAYGSQTKGSFDITAETAHELLRAPDPFGRGYEKVVLRSMNGGQLLDREDRWIIDFGESMPLKEASLYEAPFEYVKAVVKPERAERREKRQLDYWWLHARPSPKYRRILATHTRYIATAVTSKHRVFVWLTSEMLVDHAIIVFTLASDYAFGVLHSRAHEIWSRRLGTQVRDAESGFRYTPSTTVDTFPFPWPPGTEPAESEDPRVKAIADAARELVHLRDAWLNPTSPDGQPLPESALKDRTLTKLYNARPEWLANAHRTLDAAVFAAYGWPATLTDQEILARLLNLNHERAGKA